MNTAIILSYDGTAYHGWQTQRNASSVQQTVTEALASLLGQDVSVSGVGRTDAGVHARRYVANFHGTHTIPMDRLPFAINAHLPMDIACCTKIRLRKRGCEPVRRQRLRCT